MLPLKTTTSAKLIWTIIHIAMGIACTITPWSIIIWFYFVFATNLPSSLVDLSKNKIENFTYLISYLLGFELLARLSKASPFIPYELGKYLLVSFALAALALSPKRADRTGIFLLFCILPASLYDFSGERSLSNIIDDLFGPLSLSLGIMFWGGQRISIGFINQILKIIWLTSIAALLYTFIKTPDFNDIEFSLKANFETSAGHASNQVSTIFGLGMFISFYAWFKKLKFSGYILLDVIIGIAFTMQGLLTFSRGGMIVGAIAIVTLFISTQTQSVKIKTKGNLPFVRIGLILIAIYGSFQFVNTITGGMLSLRYKGETQGTIDGSQEKTIDKVTSGRYAILTDDINLWLNYPITGVGAGAGRYMKEGFGYMKASHLEPTRLLCEHGVLGIFFLLTLIKLGINVWQAKSNIELRNILFALFVIAFLTSFHAGMRTYVTPLLMLLSSLKIINSPKSLTLGTPNNNLQKNMRVISNTRMSV